MVSRRTGVRNVRMASPARLKRGLRFQIRLQVFQQHREATPAAAAALTWGERLACSITLTQLPQLAHTESSSTSSVRTGSEPRTTCLRDPASQRSPAGRERGGAALAEAHR